MTPDPHGQPWREGCDRGEPVPVAGAPPSAIARPVQTDEAQKEPMGMEYLWIAAGGALGSMGRYWVAAEMARLTGPQFPWGTILINILGSALIGLVGALTGPGGRLLVPPEARLFVMVGFCGGFTTFSSFSLQTLELMRDGRMGEALGNVGLSVLLCLGGVAAGYYGGLALNAALALGQEG